MFIPYNIEKSQGFLVEKMWVKEGYASVHSKLKVGSVGHQFLWCGPIYFIPYSPKNVLVCYKLAQIFNHPRDFFDLPPIANAKS